MSSKAKSTKSKAVKSEIVQTMSVDDWYSKYLPKDAETYSITIRVSKEERAMIVARRGVYNRRLNEAARP